MDRKHTGVRLPHFTICGLGDVQARSRLDTFSHVISIWDADAGPYGPEEVRSFFPASRFHLAMFDDTEVAGEGAVTKEIVRGILEFGAGLATSDQVLVHCLAGVSRSAGVAFALACQYAAPGEEAVVLQQLVAKAPWIKPNRRVVFFSDELLQREGRMNAAVGGIWRKILGSWADRYSP